MNKAELVSAMAEETGATKSETEKHLDAFLKVVSGRMQDEQDVKLVGFGTFGVSHRKKRVGRNPKTGTEIEIPARKVPVFRPGKELRQSCL